MIAPELVIVVGVEERPLALCLTASMAAELRLLADLEGRDDLHGEVRDAVERALMVLRRRARRTVPGGCVTEGELELAALCGIAWERRAGLDFRAAVDDILGWHDRRFVRRYGRKRRQLAYLTQLLRDTSPKRPMFETEEQGA
jgi:hypothetical protein